MTKSVFLVNLVIHNEKGGWGKENWKRLKKKKNVFWWIESYMMLIVSSIIKRGCTSLALQRCSKVLSFLTLFMCNNFMEESVIKVKVVLYRKEEEFISFTWSLYLEHLFSSSSCSFSFTFFFFFIFFFFFFIIMKIITYERENVSIFYPCCYCKDRPETQWLGYSLLHTQSDH